MWLSSTVQVGMINTCCHIVSRSLEGFQGDLAQNLDKDATLTNILLMLDEHYGMVMTFDALSKELYFLKQTSGENVAEFREHLSQPVKILQTEYLEGSNRSMLRI